MYKSKEELYKSKDELMLMSLAEIAAYIDRLEREDECAEGIDPPYQDWCAIDLSDALDEMGITDDEFLAALKAAKSR